MAIRAESEDVMACPVCSHTMHCVAIKVLWCLRCGTVKVLDDVCVPRTTQVIQAAGERQQALHLDRKPFIEDTRWVGWLGNDISAVAKTAINAVSDMTVFLNGARESRIEHEHQDQS